MHGIQSGRAGRMRAAPSAKSSLHGESIRMAASRHRTAFLLGVVLGVTAGIAAAFINAPQSGRRTRDQIQQSAERVIFKMLDMVPSTHAPSDTVTSSQPAATATDLHQPVDVVLASRPSEMGAHQTP